MPQIISGRAAYRDLMAELVAEARRDIAVFSPSLSPQCYNDRALVGGLRQFLLVSRRTQVRILVSDQQQLLRQGGLILELAQVLSSRIHFRVLEDPDQLRQAVECMIVDHSTALRRNTPDASEAQLHRLSPVARRAARDFDAMWDLSPPASALRRLHL